MLHTLHLSTHYLLPEHHELTALLLRQLIDLLLRELHHLPRQGLLFTLRALHVLLSSPVNMHCMLSPGFGRLRPLPVIDHWCWQPWHANHHSSNMPRESPTPKNVSSCVLQPGVRSRLQAGTCNGSTITSDALDADVTSDAVSRERCAHARRNDSDM